MKDLRGNEIKLGPVTPEEANLLTAITRMVAAQHIVEFGYYNGTSAKAFLDGMNADGRVISLDILDRKPLDDNRLTLVKADMTNFDSNILPNEIDIVLFDASHRLDDNIKAYKAIEEHLTSDSIIIVHDTGLWDTTLYTDIPFTYISRYMLHRPDEVAFVEWLKKIGYNAIDFNTTTEFRCGLTVLQ